MKFDVRNFWGGGNQSMKDRMRARKAQREEDTRAGKAFAEKEGVNLLYEDRYDLSFASGKSLSTSAKDAISEARKKIRDRLTEQRKKALATMRRMGLSNNQETSKQLGVQAPESLLGAGQTVLNTTNGGTSLLGR